jgi:hypothetical protein
MHRAAKGILFVLAMGVTGTVAVKAASPPDLSGSYQCHPAPAPCHWSGHNPSITQTGTNLQIKSDQGDISAAKLTSDTTISAGPTYNSIGIIRPDQSIDWSDGTKWRKQ